MLVKGAPRGNLWLLLLILVGKQITQYEHIPIGSLDWKRLQYFGRLIEPLPLSGDGSGKDGETLQSFLI